MRSTILFHALIVAILSHLAFASAIEKPAGLTARDDTNGTVFTPYGEVVSTLLPDRKHKIEFFSDGILGVTVLEREDGGVTVYDIDGNEVNMDDLNDDDDALEKGVSKWRLAIKSAKLIAKYRKRAWTYIYCVSTAPF